MTNTARLRELLAAATPGPWDQGKWGVYADAAVNFDNENGAGMIASICTGFENGCEPAANMQLIVEAVNALPKLLAVVEAERGITGKPLVWKVEPDSGGFEHGHWPGLDGRIRYSVFAHRKGSHREWYAYFDDPDEDELAEQSPFPSLQEAKAACQQHFNSLVSQLVKG